MWAYNLYEGRLASSSMAAVIGAAPNFRAYCCKEDSIWSRLLYRTLSAVWKSIDCAIGVWNDGRFSRCEVWGARRTLGVCAARISGRLRCWVDESLRFKQDNIKKQNGQHYNIPEDPQTCEKNLKSIRRASSNKTAHRRTTIPAKTCKFVGCHMLHGHCSVCWHTFCSILQQRNIQHYSKTETSNQSSQKDGQDKRETHWEPKHWNFFEKAHAVSCQTCSQILKVQVQHYCYGASLKTGCCEAGVNQFDFVFGNLSNIKFDSNIIMNTI